MATKKAASKKPPAKKAAPKKTSSKKSGAKKTPVKKAAAKKAPAKKKNKLGVKNSLVNNINAKKKKGTSNTKKKSTISKESYDDMEKGWK